MGEEREPAACLLEFNHLLSQPKSLLCLITNAEEHTCALLVIIISQKYTIIMSSSISAHISSVSTQVTMDEQSSLRAVLARRPGRAPDASDSVVENVARSIATVDIGEGQLVQGPPPRPARYRSPARPAAAAAAAAAPHPPAAAVHPPPGFHNTSQVWIGNLPDGLSAQYIAEMFQRYGARPTHVNLVLNEPYGFVTFAQPSDVTLAINSCDGLYIGDSGRRLQVRNATSSGSRRRWRY